MIPNVYFIIPNIMNDFFPNWNNFQLEMTIYAIRFVGTFVIFGSVYMIILILLRNYVGSDNPKLLTFLMNRGKKKYNWYQLWLEEEKQRISDIDV